MLLEGHPDRGNDPFLSIPSRMLHVEKALGDAYKYTKTFNSF